MIPCAKDGGKSKPAVDSYIDGTPATGVPPSEPNSQEISESTIHRNIGEAMLLIMIAADLALGFLVGLLVRMHTDEDYTAWTKLKKLNELVLALEQRVAQFIASIEIAKKHCMVGILRAQNARAQRHPPYHKALTMLLFCILFVTHASWGQNIERYEGILIDTSGSIGKGGRSSDLFREYLFSTKKILLTEPPNARVWVSIIATDSFGGVHEILKGWTPDARGVFTDDLTRARRELASGFEVKSSGMSPVAAGTDIFGALWHLKMLFESSPKADGSHALPKTIWIFSDMMNETPNFPMPELIVIGPERMLERAKANGLLIPLRGYKVYVLGASPSGLTPQVWLAVKTFWTAYFRAAGAELASYSAECDVER